jgi:hypothetical protein
MPCRWGELLACGAALALARPAPAQQVREIGIQAIGTLSDPDLAVLGGYGALRASARTRVSALVGAGIAGGDWVGRGELLGHFLLAPDQRRKAGFYLAGGIAGVIGAVDRGYLVLTAGLESSPASGGGWVVEAGIGGGFRLALGYRWRHFGLKTQ